VTAVDGVYRTDDRAPLQQGDVLLAPVARIAAASSAATVGPSAALDQQLTPLDGPEPSIPAVRVAAGWGPVVVVSHDCHLDKEFNRRYRELRAAGAKKGAAIADAAADPSLDRWLVVSPILDLAAVTDPGDTSSVAAASAAHQGTVIGYLPVPPNVDRGIVGGVADLNWQATIDRAAIVARLASMTERGRSALRMALARTTALRTPEVGFALEDIIGDRIMGARQVSDAPLLVELQLQTNGAITLLAQPGEPPAGGPQRTRQSAPRNRRTP